MSKFRWNKNQVVTTNPFTYCNISSAAAPIFKQMNFFWKSTKKVQAYQYKNPQTKINKIQLIIIELSNHIILCQIRIMDRNWCFCLILLYQTWLISFLWFLIETYESPEPGWWNHQMRGHDYKAEGDHVLNSPLTA